MACGTGPFLKEFQHAFFAPQHPEVARGCYVRNVVGRFPGWVRSNAFQPGSPNQPARRGALRMAILAFCHFFRQLLPRLTSPLCACPETPNMAAITRVADIVSKWTWSPPLQYLRNTSVTKIVEQTKSRAQH